MEVTEDETTQYYGKRSNIVQVTLLPYHYEWTFIACGRNVIKHNCQLRKNQQKK